MPKGLVLKGWLINNVLSSTPIDRGMRYQKTLLRVGKPLWLASQGVNQMVHAKPSFDIELRTKCEGLAMRGSIDLTVKNVRTGFTLKGSDASTNGGVKA